ncbi:HNH endonuclease signature motif containing protein [Streptomyces spectabilis]|uniref:HNH endonuclease signature motif containing protein n=1 Tax=Streptomyces spectabilis TaxID=68270 RepID=UPI0033CC3DC2
MDRPTPAERFTAKTAPGPVPANLDTPCRLWPESSLDRDGYGRFWVEGRVVPAHRWAYEQARGPIPAGLELDHLCTVRRCVAADHLDPVDHRTNVLRSTSPSAINARRTRCVNGHDLTDPANVRVSHPPSHPNGMRRCRACTNARRAIQTYADRLADEQALAEDTAREQAQP